jgi:CheY-like chemotaxis protein
MTALLVELVSDKISVVISLAPGLRPVIGRSSELEQLIMNLVVNARDAMPRGGTVTIRACDVRRAHAAPEAGDADEILLTVTDTGEGMDAATRGRIFEPFFTTKAPGAGTGLGLATVYAVVTRSRGRIDVASEPGAGTTFSIWLPAAHALPTEPRVSCDERVSRGAPVPTLEGTIVVVEDDEQVRLAICDVLKEAGLHVIEACDGIEALRACRGHAGQVDLVLSDMVMPKLGGTDLARRLAAFAPSTKIIYMSGNPHGGLPGIRPHELGAVLQKPFTPGQLLDRIRDALGSPEAAQAAAVTAPA